MIASLLIALDLPRWLPHELFWPVLVGLGATLAVFVPIAVVRRNRRNRQKPAPPEVNRGPEYDPFLQGSSTEKRARWRRRGNAVRVMIRGPGCMDDPLVGWVIDRSSGGLGLSVPKEFPPDTRISVLPDTGSSVVPWIDVTVCSARRESDGWHIGCQFIETPQWSILLLFG